MIEPAGERASVALVCMPWVAVYRPSLALSLLKSRLAAVGRRSDVHYLNLRFADRVLSYFSPHGTRADLEALPDHVRELIRGAASHAELFDEWVFARAFYGDAIPDPGAYRERFLDGRYSAHDIDQLLGLLPLVRAFIDQCVHEIDWSSY